MRYTGTFMGICLFFLLSYVPLFGQVDSKTCGKCGRVVSSYSSVGQSCPHCGAHWTRSNGHSNASQDGNAGKFGLSNLYLDGNFIGATLGYEIHLFENFGLLLSGDFLRNKNVTGVASNGAKKTYNITVISWGGDIHRYFGSKDHGLYVGIGLYTHGFSDKAKEDKPMYKVSVMPIKVGFDWRLGDGMHLDMGADFGYSSDTWQAAKVEKKKLYVAVKAQLVARFE